MRRLLPFTLLLPAALAAQGSPVPTIDDLLNVKNVGQTAISPDGQWVAYTVSEPDFAQDAFVSQVWLVNAQTGERLQLTRGPQGANSPRWSPDGHWLAFVSARTEGKPQLFVIDPRGGEARALTAATAAVQGYAWSGDGSRIAFTATDQPDAPAKERKEKFGDFEVVRRDYGFAHLYTLDVGAALARPQVGTARTVGHDYSVAAFSWSPDGQRIAFAATKNPDLVQGATSDIYVLTLASNAVKRIVDQPGPDNGPLWSPDGTRILFSTQMGKQNFFALNAKLAVVSADGGAIRSLTDSFDENPQPIEWTSDGIYFAAGVKTNAHLFRLDPSSGATTRVSSPDQFIGQGFSLSRDGSRAAFVVASPTTLGEVAVSDVRSWAPKTLTAMTDQTRGWNLASRETISWPSKDGATIEGVLLKPRDFDASKKYPLLVIIHGGPTGTDRPTLLDARYYPADLWTARGALVLKVNYRGSAGYGEKFRTLNYRNLGVGDAWDVLSGVDHLIKKGWVDSTKMAAMGWSQGGYISAFLTTSTTRFKAISVGAGISDWATYYYNTDITPFTVNYLGANPVDDPAIYAKTSPIAYVKGAKTPTLIQHGELDRRVPIANGYELRQALEDRGVPVEMVIYKGFPHGIGKPKGQRAVMTHNLRWFNHYIFGDPMPDLTAVSGVVQ